jgi:nitrate reductase delta subunit
MKKDTVNPPTWLAASYRLIGELLLHPAERDDTTIQQALEIVRAGPASILTPIERFLEKPEAHSADEYVQTVELAPPCPLYLGHYLFDEPESCHSIGLSGRNEYMIELINIYKHFGFEMSNREMSDFLPVMVDFLGISLERPEFDRIGLRGWFLENFLQPGIVPLREKLEKYESPYAMLVESLEAALKEDAASLQDQPVWKRPVKDSIQEKGMLPQT